MGRNVYTESHLDTDGRRVETYTYDVDGLDAEADLAAAEVYTYRIQETLQPLAKPGSIETYTYGHQRSSAVGAE